MEKNDQTERLSELMLCIVYLFFQVRKSIHMHSFTFDFHLRTIHQLVSGKPTFRKGFNLVLFLDDFMMYYNKGPNFARNAIHRGSIEIPCTQEWINDIQVNQHRGWNTIIRTGQKSHY